MQETNSEYYYLSERIPQIESRIEELEDILKQ